jgi:aspartate kinase
LSCRRLAFRAKTSRHLGAEIIFVFRTPRNLPEKQSESWRIFEIFDQHETPVDILATSEVSVSLTIDNAERLPQICAGLKPFSEVSVDNNRAIVCAVGEGLHDAPGVAGRVFRALEGIHVHMISQGASRLNVSFVVATEDLQSAVAALHREFFTQLDPAVFG